MRELIYKDDAIYIASGYCHPANVAKEIAKLPAVEPEIIHCKDCVYGEQDEDNRWYCHSLGCCVGNEDGSGFCADAERRTDD